MAIKVTIPELENILNELYLTEILVITDAGIRLTFKLLMAFMRNPINAKKRVEDMLIDSRIVDNNNTITAKFSGDLFEAVAKMLVGSKDKKWLSKEEIIGRLTQMGYTITTIDDEK